MRKLSAIPLFVLATLIVSNCSPGLPGSASGAPVTFVIAIDDSVFSEREPVRIRLWDEAQLAIADRTANCAISYDAVSGEQQVFCPEGVVYEEATPEEALIWLQDAGEAIELRSQTVRVGERYRLQISGLASDDCNRASAQVEDMARSETVVVENLLWMTTMMACPELGNP